MAATSSHRSTRSIAGTAVDGSIALFGLSAWVLAPAPSAAPAEPLAATVQVCAQVSVNNATETQLVAAFESVQIPKAGRWAHEVMEYRPYPVDDPTFGKLKAELSKYRPSPDVLAQIVACLSLP